MLSAARARRLVLGAALLTAGRLWANELESEPTLPESESELVAVDWEDETLTKPESGTYIPRVGLRYHSPGGIGHHSAYLSFEGFLPAWQSDGQFVTFGDLRFLLYHGRLGMNLGAGQRFYSETLKHSIGTYAYFDHLDTGRRTVRQISGGMDILGTIWEGRGNVYLPIDTDRRFVDSQLTNAMFSGNQLLSDRLLIHETALKGFDVESGWLLSSRFNLWGFTGIYHYQGEGTQSAWGGRGRLEMRVSDSFKVQLSVQDDRVFGTNVLVGFAAHFPGISAASGGSSSSPRDRLGEEVKRQQNIVVCETYETDRVIPLDRRTGEPFVVYHVAENANGEGTYENPFGSITEALNAAGTNSIIYVQPNDAGYAESLVLSTGQYLLGSGAAHQIPTTVGSTTLAAQTDTQPTILASSGPAITLANGTAVAGFDITGGTGTSILGTGVSGFVLRDNTLTGGLRGIELQNATGSGLIQSNTISDTEEEAILVQNTDTSLSLAIYKNTISDANTSGVALGSLVLLADNSSDFSFVSEVVANSIEDSEGDGVHLQSLGEGSTQTLVSSNVIADVSGDGISALVTQGPLVMEASTNTISGCQNGIELRADGADGTEASLTLSQNVIAYNERAGVKLVADDEAELAAELSENSIQLNDDEGVRMLAGGDALLSVSASSNIVHGNAIGMALTADGSSDSQAALVLDSNTISGSDQHGVDVAGLNDATVVLSASSNTFASNDGDGMALSVAGDATFAVELTENQFSDNADGLSMVTNGSDSSQSTLVTSDNQFSSNAGDGVSVRAEGEAGLIASMDGDSIEDNGDTGLTWRVSDEANVQVLFDGLTVSDNLSEGMLLQADGTADEHQLRAAVRDTTIDGSTTPGLLAQTLDDGRLLLELDGNDSNHDFYIQNNGSSQSRLTLAIGTNDGSVVTQGDITLVILDFVGLDRQRQA